MKRLFLTIALMASYSSIYCMNDALTQADKTECINLTRALQSYNYNIPLENCDPQEDSHDIICQYISDNRNLIESLVTRMNNLIVRYPHNALVQQFVPTRNTMQQILQGLIVAEQDEETSESN